MEDNYSIDEILSAVNDLQKISKDKNKKIVSGDPEKIKKIYDTWVFSKDVTSANPNWMLVNILN